MKRAINIAIGLASIALALTLLLLILMCAGVVGKSAYGIAKKNGFDGTEKEWLQSLVGEQGKSAYQMYVESLPKGETPLTEEQWINSFKGTEGQRGATWFSGSDEPDVEEARDGDFYLRVYSDFATRRGLVIYTFSGGEWTVVADMSYEATGDSVTDYRIRSKSDFEAFVAATESDKLNGFEGKTVYLDYDVQIDSANWTGIGSQDKPFRGAFDGRNHEVTIMRKQTEKLSVVDPTGFFANLGDDAKITNLTVNTITEKYLDFVDVHAWDNKGVATQYYAIKSVDGLATFRDAVNSGNSFAKQIVKLVADVDLSEQGNWTPIGTQENKFQGTFYGNNRTVSNLTCKVEKDYAGLFGYASNATFKNLTIDGATLEGEGYVGALLGASFPSGRIENVTVKNVTANGSHYIGGIVGAGYITVEDCKAYQVNITATPNLIGDDVYDNGDKIGGIAGQIREYDTIHRCAVEDVTLKGYRDIGGVAGYAYSLPETHTAKGVSITVDQTNFYEYKPTNIGGIFGYSTKGTSGGVTENVTYALDNVRVTKSQELINMLTLVNQIKPTRSNIVLESATYSPTANEQLRITADNVTLNGAGETATVIDTKGYYCSGQAAMEIMGNGCTLSNLKITGAPENKNVAMLKVTNLNNEIEVVENFKLSHVTIDNTSDGAMQGHGLNLHGVDGATIDYLTVNNYGKCGIAFAKATDVVVTNTNLTDSDNTNWANVGFMYSATSVDAYKTGSDVTVDFSSCTFGTNSGGAALIYSERPSQSHDGNVDVIRDVTLGLITKDNVPRGWTYTSDESGTWALTRQSSSGSTLQKN